MKQYEKINEKDNVAVALQLLHKGQNITIENISFELLEDIEQGHKFALCPIKKDDNIIKYGNPIGHAIANIQRGEHIHTHNMKTNLSDNLEYDYKPIQTNCTSQKYDTFNGYIRTNGKVGIRNEIWIVTTVGCVNNIATTIANICNKNLPDNVESVVAFPHPYGCSQMGDDQEYSRTILADLVNHPNAGGVLVLGLGCENSNIDILKNYIGEYDEQRVKFLVAQDCENEIEVATEMVKQLINYASTFHRQKVSSDKLIVGLKCGGSDGLSGITANPTVGVFSDILISKGGSTILTEVPEMFGAEQLLMNRCQTKEVFDKTVGLINNFKDYFKSHNQTIYENPSPGNKAGGISTLEDKSLGCTQKSGNSPVVDVIQYGQTVKKNGLTLLQAPGNDLVASTALACSGAQIVLFTTGRGTPFASPVPTVKISTNNPLAKKKSNWIDFNCGDLVVDKDLSQLSKQLYDFVIEVANGKLVKSEEAGFHDMAIFKQGVTL